MPNKKLRRQLEGLFANRLAVEKDSPPPEPEPPRAPGPPALPEEPRLLGWTWETDTLGYYTYCSLEVISVLGYTPDEMRGHSLTHFLIQDSDVDPVIASAISHIGISGPLDDLRLTARRKDGATVSLVTHGRPLLDEHSRLIGYQGVTHLAPSPLTEMEPEPGFELPPPPAQIEAPPIIEHNAAWALTDIPALESAPDAEPVAPSDEPPPPLAETAALPEPEAAPRPFGVPASAPPAGEAVNAPGAVEIAPGPAPTPELATPVASDINAPSANELPPTPIEEAANPRDSQRLTVIEWRALLDKQGDQAWGYLDSGAGLQAVGDFTTPTLDAALAQGAVFVFDDHHRTPLPDATAPLTGRGLAIPIQLQNQTIGALDFFEAQGGEWEEDDLALVQAVTDQLALALENARLFNATNDQLTKRTLLYEVTRAAAAATHLNEALHSAVTALSRVFPEASIAILLLDGDTRTLRSRATVGFPAALSSDLMTHVGRGVIGRAAETNQPQRVGDVRQVHDYVAWDTRTISELAVPLSLGDRVIGVLNVESPRPHAFDASDEQLLLTLAGTLAAIIVNNNLLEQINHERERLVLLNDMLAELTQTLDMSAQLKSVLDFAPRLGAEHGYVLLLGETEADTIFRTTLPGLEQLSEHALSRVGNLTAQSGLTAWMLQRQQSAWLNDTLQDNRWRPGPDPDQEPARSVIAVPLRTPRGALSGVLAYTHTRPGRLTRDQVSLVEAISAQVTVALENARLYSQTRLQRRNAEALARATQAMNRSALDESRLFEVLGEELTEGYQPEAVIVWKWEPATYGLIAQLTRLNEAEASPETRASVSPTVTLRAADRPDLFRIIQTMQGAITPLREVEGRVTESMAYPLMYGGEVENVVEVVHTSAAGGRGLDQDDLNLLQGMMTGLTAALQTARLYTIQRETAERLAEVDRLKSQFLANMSHELRTPLNSIIGFSRVILKGIDGPLTDLQGQDLTSIYNSGQHLLGLINDILDLARIEAGKMELVLDEVDLHDIFKGVMSTAIGLVKDKQIRLVEDIAPHLPPVRADQIRVRQILLNLLSNASKFTEEGTITLRALLTQAPSPASGKEEPFVQISVVDTGHGIAPEDIKKLFEPFSQVDASATRKVGGTGLGLNITRQLVDLHGGRIWVESEVGVGSTFSFLLPLNRPEISAPDTPAEIAAANNIILSIDDDQGVQQLYRRYLEPHGYKVIGVSKSVDALLRVMEFKPMVILLDVLMPGKDGWQVLSELKQSASVRQIPVIMCTIASDPERAAQLGAADYLTKPILESDLLRALKKLQLPEPANGKAPTPQALAATN